MKSILAAGLLALSLGPGAASAATLTATWNINGQGGSTNTFGNVALDPGNIGDAFTIEFDDLNSNMLLDAGEVTSFSGLTYLSGGGTITRLGVDHWLDIAGFTVGTGLLGNRGWIFRANPNTGTTSTFFNNTFAYNIDFGPGPGNGTVIPLPASAWLLIAALGGLGVMRRRAIA